MSNKTWYYNNEENTYVFPEINKVAKGGQKILLSDEDIDKSEFLTALITNGSIVMYDESDGQSDLDEFNHTHLPETKETPEDVYLHNPDQKALIIGGDDTVIENIGGSEEEISLDPSVVNSRIEPKEDNSKKKI